MREKLYFIAIIAPENVAAEINAFKYDIKDNYNSKAALKVMPHITLKAPFKLFVEEHITLMSWFENMRISVRPFPTLLENFGCFNTKHSKVIYVKPVYSPSLNNLQAEIIDSFSKAYPLLNMSTHEKEFSPHMTIAYRDLTPENFEIAWRAYREKRYTSSFTCKSFCLLQHNGLKWEVIAEHLL